MQGFQCVPDERTPSLILIVWCVTADSVHTHLTACSTQHYSNVACCSIHLKAGIIGGDLF